ncbi:MAG: YfcE family phosphodiesterase [Gammaproteobacteria bacterium AqS3]|nr:YfcE family phosphodiesterase [Gammaproteobacteria bacterium AqS3]
MFNDAGVDRVIHTGDITRPKTLELFEALNAPLWGVYGNNDQEEIIYLDPVAERLGFRFQQPPLMLDWCERRIVVVHDPLEFDGADLSGCDLMLHGHTHRRRIEHSEDGALIFNPGECAGTIAGLNAVGVLDLATLRPEILSF